MTRWQTFKRNLRWSWECYTGIEKERASYTRSHASPATSNTAPAASPIGTSHADAMEHHRTHDDGDTRRELEEAENHMSVLWLRHITGTTGIPR